MGLFNRKPASSPVTLTRKPKSESTSTDIPTAENAPRRPRKGSLPRYNSNGHQVTKYVHPDGESGRKDLRLLVQWRLFPQRLQRSSNLFLLSLNFASKWVNLLWPFVPAAVALHFARPDLHVWIFAINYIAMVPAANLIGFAGQELARKMPKVSGILVETALGSVVEIVLFMVLIKKDNGTGDVTSKGDLIPVIQAAILGSVLTNILLCLGLCFFVGGIKRSEQKFHASISEAGSGLLLVAGFGLLIPSAFFAALKGSTVAAGKEGFTQEKLRANTMKISQGTSIILIVAFLIYVFYNAMSHDGVLTEALEADEELDEDRADDLAKPKFTFTECILALAGALACVTLVAIFLVQEIQFIVKMGVPDNFMGLILVPLVEKAAEHLTAVDEAWDNQINFALYHCLGPSIQTALFNGPLVVIVGWGLGKPMDLNFEIFMVVVLILSILVVGRFLQDGSSNYLEGTLLVLVYIIIAITTWYYPNADETSANTLNTVVAANSTTVTRM